MAWNIPSVQFSSAGAKCVLTLSCRGAKLARNNPKMYDARVWWDLIGCVSAKMFNVCSMSALCGLFRLNFTRSEYAVVVVGRSANVANWNMAVRIISLVFSLRYPSFPLLLLMVLS